MIVETTKHDGQLIEFFDILELGQGGPDTGYLKVNSKQISKEKFGRNIVIYDDYLFCPIYSGFGEKSGFTICSVCLKSNAIIESEIRSGLIRTLEVVDGFLAYEDHGLRKRIVVSQLV